MHVPTGEIINETFEGVLESLERGTRDSQMRRLADEKRKIVSLSDDEVKTLEPLTPQKRKGWMRNQPCVCGSGKKFKRCCWGQYR